MTCTLHVAWDDRLTGYDFGPGHPMAPIRLKLTMELSDAFGLGRQDGVSVQVPAPPTSAWCGWRAVPNPRPRTSRN
jgi:acetoin utilization protein AcuC